MLTNSFRSRKQSDYANCGKSSATLYGAYEKVQEQGTCLLVCRLIFRLIKHHLGFGYSLSREGAVPSQYPPWWAILRNAWCARAWSRAGSVLIPMVIGAHLAGMLAYLAERSRQQVCQQPHTLRCRQGRESGRPSGTTTYAKNCTRLNSCR